MKIQKELDETKIVLHKTIESVLERGEKIDSLVEKSDGLSAQSKMFYKYITSSTKSNLRTTTDNFKQASQGQELVLCGYVIMYYPVSTAFGNVMQ